MQPPLHVCSKLKTVVKEYMLNSIGRMYNRTITLTEVTIQKIKHDNN